MKLNTIDVIDEWIFFFFVMIKTGRKNGFDVFENVDDFYTKNLISIL